APIPRRAGGSGTGLRCCGPRTSTRSWRCPTQTPSPWPGGPRERMASSPDHRPAPISSPPDGLLITSVLAVALSLSRLTAGSSTSTGRFTADRRIEMTAHARPPFDAELEPALDAVPAFFTTLAPNSIAEFRAATTRPSSLDEIIAGRPVQVTDHAVIGHG